MQCNANTLCKDSDIFRSIFTILQNEVFLGYLWPLHIQLLQVLRLGLGPHSQNFLGRFLILGNT